MDRPRITDSSLNGGPLIYGRIKSMDIIRAVACLCVVFYHTVVYIPFLNKIFFMFGRIGVALFFMISGTLMINGYHSRLDTKKFYIKRAKSIYIPFYTAYIMMFVFLLIKNKFRIFTSAPLYTLFFTVLGIDGYAPVLEKPSFYILGEWFLPVIIMIYIIFPLWRKIFLRYPKTLLAALFTARILLTVKNIFPFPLCFNIIPALSYFTLGAYIIVLISNTERKAYDKKYILPSAVSAVIGIFISHVANIPDIGEIFSSVGVFILLFIISDGIDSTVIIKPLNCISRLSYEIFLTHHVIINYVVSKVAENVNVFTAAAGAAAIILLIALAAWAVNKISSFIQKQL